MLAPRRKTGREQLLRKWSLLDLAITSGLPPHLFHHCALLTASQSPQLLSRLFPASLITFCCGKVERDQSRASREKRLKKEECLLGAGVPAQQLTALAAFVEESGSVPRVYLWLTCVCNTSFKISDNSSGLCEQAHSAQACGQSTQHIF